MLVGGDVIVLLGLGIGYALVLMIEIGGLLHARAPEDSADSNDDH